MPNLFTNFTLGEQNHVEQMVISTRDERCVITLNADKKTYGLVSHLGGEDGIAHPEQKLSLADCILFAYSVLGAVPFQMFPPIPTENQFKQENNDD